jgi:hypothetical protein
MNLQWFECLYSPTQLTGEVELCACAPLPLPVDSTRSLGHSAQSEMAPAFVVLLAEAVAAEAAEPGTATVAARRWEVVVGPLDCAGVAATCCGCGCDCSEGDCCCCCSSRVGARADSGAARVAFCGGASLLLVPGPRADCDALSSEADTDAVPPPVAVAPVAEEDDEEDDAAAGVASTLWPCAPPLVRSVAAVPSAEAGNNSASRSCCCAVWLAALVLTGLPWGGTTGLGVAGLSTMPPPPPIEEDAGLRVTVSPPPPPPLLLLLLLRASFVDAMAALARGDLSSATRGAFPVASG